MCLNSQWFQKYEPSKLKKRKTLRFPYLDGFIFCSLNLDVVFVEPPEVREHNVPHLKDLISANLNPRAEGRGSTFTFCAHTLLKKVILEGKGPKV